MTNEDARDVAVTLCAVDASVFADAKMVPSRASDARDSGKAILGGSSS